MKRLIAVLAVAVASVAALSTTAGAASAACSASVPTGATLVASTSVDSRAFDGDIPSPWSATYSLPKPTTVTLPATANYQVVACGTWDNFGHGYVDAAYNAGYVGYGPEDWTNHQQGWPGNGAIWGQLLINGAVPGWGAYNPTHVYSTTLTGASGSLKLDIYDGDTTGPLWQWYFDNYGSLSVDIYQLPPPRPTSADQCKNGGWQNYGGIFKNQGDCVSFVATNGKNPPAGK